jgi:molybdopterin converting factor small subunit
MDELMELTGLMPHPADEWERMLRFVALTKEDKSAMVATVEALLRAAPKLVEDTYNYLQRVPETAAVLGWEQGFDQAHLQERRRFFTVWVARTIGMDFGEDFAMYLFRAGKFHAAHGPRAIHVPETYVTGSIGLVQAAFAAAIAAEIQDAAIVARALAGWAKYLSVQLNQMTMGYRAARAVDSGAVTVQFSVFGRLRPLLGRNVMTVRADEGGLASDILRKFFDYAPQTRGEALDRIWREALPSKPDALWPEIVPVYLPKSNWRVMLNGRELRYNGGLGVPVHAGDEVALFPPGR